MQVSVQEVAGREQIAVEFDGTAIFLDPISSCLAPGLSIQLNSDHQELDTLIECCVKLTEDNAAGASRTSMGDFGDNRKRLEESCLIAFGP